MTLRESFFKKIQPNAHWFGSWVTALIIATIALTLLRSPFGVITLIFLIEMVWRGTLVADRNQFPIVIKADTKAATDQFQRGRIFSKRKVRKFIVRENKNRECDDAHLTQIYLEL